MFGQKKNSGLQVRIPSSVLKKEAEKMARKMVSQELQKEKQKQQKDRLKIKGKKVSKKEDEKVSSDLWGEGMKKEIVGGIWIVTGLILFSLFFSEETFSRIIVAFLKSLFGIGVFILPLFSFGIGLFFILKKEVRFSPSRGIALFFFFLSILAFIQLFVPQEESLERSDSFGGSLGFAISYFPREAFGDLVSGVLLLGLFWITGMISFGFRISDLFQKNNDDALSEDEREEVSNERESPFQEKIVNVPKPSGKKPKQELEIIDALSHKAKEKTKSKDEEDPFTLAKKKHRGEMWTPPSIDILRQDTSTIVVDENALRRKAEIIREKLEQFDISVTMKSVHVGPTVTQFTLEPSAGVKLNRITGLKNDLALALAAKNIRIEAPIPGKSLVGIEIPNEHRAVVGMREILESEVWEKEKAPLKLAFGRDVAGKPFVADLAKMPHLLIAGKTGSGKSVAMNAFLCSLLWNNHPELLKLILVDPKRVELTLYNNLPHLLTPVITEPDKCVSALAWAVAEMNRRYKTFARESCRNIIEYNEKFPHEKEPYIVIVIDELADLMMVAGKDVEAAICRIAQMARAVGMHLLVATQRPSVDVVTGLIKANLSARIAFKVSSGIDSRTILDGIGAEDLLGFGDMLYLDGNSGHITRLQGLFITNQEVERLTNHIKLQFPEMMSNDEITRHSIEGMAKGGVLTAGTTDENSEDDFDDLFEEAVDIVIETGKASASFLQRRLEIGYARAARILDQMEAKGIIGPAKGAKAREVYGRKESSDSFDDE